MRFLSIVAVVLLIGLAGYMLAELYRSQHLVDPTDRCTEAAPTARQAFEAGAMGSRGMRVEELTSPQRAAAPEGAVPGLILCRAEASFSSGVRDTLWYALQPTAGGADGQFTVHAGRGENGRRIILDLR